MTVWVDPPRKCLAGPSWPWGEACHLLADDLDELHRFARGLGLKREWFQGPPAHRVAHYDLAAAMRVKAVRAGAVELKTWAEVRAAFARARCT